MSRETYEKINKMYEKYNRKMHKKRFICFFADNDFNSQVLNTLDILLKIIGERNDDEFHEIFEKYIFKITLNNYYYNKMTKDSFNKFFNDEDFCDKILNCRCVSFFVELQSLFMNIHNTLNEISFIKKEKKKRKKNIPSTIRRLVWNTYIGEDIGKARCTCCNTTFITQLSFHCGHIIAEVNGGETVVSNLKPICQNCNSSMRTKNMNDFVQKLQ